MENFLPTFYKQKSRGVILCFSSMLVVKLAQPKGPTIMLEG